MAKWTPETVLKKPLLQTGLWPRWVTGATGDEPCSSQLPRWSFRTASARGWVWRIKATSQLHLIPTSRVFWSAGCVQIDGTFLEAVLMIPLDQEIKGHTEIARMWKEVSPENWVTQGWMRIGLCSQSRAENWGSLPNNAAEKQDQGWNYRIIALILHFPFIITLSLYTAFLLRSSKYLQRYYLSCHHTITVNDYYQLHFTHGGRKAWRAEASHPSLPSKTPTASKLSTKCSCPALPKECSSPHQPSQMLVGTPGSVGKYIWEMLLILLSHNIP